MKIQPPAYSRPSRPGSSLHLILGPPGTGKTTTLINKVIAALRTASDSEIAFVSFTKGACEEAADRLRNRAGQGLKLPYFRTLHSLGYRMAAQAGLIRRDDQLMTRSLVRQFANDGNWKLSYEIDEEDLEGTATAEHDGLMLAVEWSRNRCLPLVDGLAAVNKKLNKDFELREAEHFYNSYLRWKRSNRAYDFMDMLEFGIESGERCPVRIVYIDEAQDLSPLQQVAVEKWFDRVDEMTIVGDDDQCQPAGTMVLTLDGEVPIEQIKVGDTVMSWNRNEQTLRARGKTVTRTSRRHHNGSLFRVHVGDKATQATAEHRFIARFQSRRLDLWVTYIMYRPDRGYRVGWCQLFRADGVLHIGARMRLEKATALWILKIHHDKNDASAHESIVSAVYGVPTATFSPLGGNTLYTEETLSKIFSAIPRTGGENALAAHGRDPSLPFWPPPGAGGRRGRSTLFEVFTCNLLPEVMLLPVQSGGWAKVDKVVQTWTLGDVYSLEVEGDHTYVADGIVTHNCIYEFQGCDPRWLMAMSKIADSVHVLSQSYRVPSAAHAYAMQIVTRNAERLEKTYLPKPEDGKITFVNADDLTSETPFLVPKEDETHQSFYLARTNRLAANFIAQLAMVQQPWRSFGSSKAILDPQVLWTARWAVEAIIGKASRTPVLQKAQLDALLCYSSAPTLSWDERGALWGKRTLMAKSFGDVAPKFAALLQRDPWAFLGPRNVPIHVKNALSRACVGGWEWLLDDPTWVLGTIHASKGKEANTVVVSTSWSKRAITEASTSPAAAAAEVRLAYVAVTRTKDELVILEDPEERFKFDFPAR